MNFRTGLRLTMAAMACAAATAVAATNTWRGVNTTNATSIAQTSVNDAALWSGGSVPGSGDTADFLFNETSSNWREQLELAGPFAPANLILRSSLWNGPLTVPLYLRQNLSLGWLRLQYGYSSAGQGDQVLRIGNAAEKGWLMLRSSDITAVTGTTRITGDTGYVDINFTGKNTADGVTNAINSQTALTGVAARKSSSDVYVESVNAPGLVDAQPQGGAVFRTTRWATGGVVRTSAGLSATNVTLTLTDAFPLDLTNGTRTSSGCISIGPGSKLALTAPSLTLWPLSSGATARVLSGTNGMVDFAATAGSVTLSGGGYNSEGVLHLGNQRLRARSDQIGRAHV